MEPLRIQTPASYWTAWTVVAALGIETITSLIDHDSFTVWLIPAVVLAALALLCYWLEYTRSQRVVEIDKQHNEVSVHSVSILLTPEVVAWSLDLFDSVRCYTSLGGSPENRVELIGHAEGDSLCIATFSPDKARGSFWSLPTLAENPRATALRQQVAACTGLKDLGFLGTKLGKA